MSGQVSGSSYIERKLDVTITLGEGEFGGTGSNSVKLSGLRALATIQRRGPPSFSSAEVRVFGVPPSIMNKVSTLGVPLTIIRANNTITIEAGDTKNGMAVVFRGTIYNSWQNLDSQPETFLNVVSLTGLVDAMKPVAPISYTGTADVATIMQGLATQMGRTFENNGVQVQLSNPYFPGTALEQAQAVARAANIEMLDDGDGGVLAIWPKNKTRGGTAPLISVDTGMVGYPRFRDFGMDVRCLFNPSIRFGGKVVVRSSIGDSTLNVPTEGGTFQQHQAAGPNGEWYVNLLTYELSAQVPNGPWFCDLSCGRTFVPA